MTDESSLSTAGKLRAQPPALGWARVAYGIDRRGENLRFVRARRSARGILCESVKDEQRVARELAAGVAVGVACLSPRESLLRWLEAPFASRRKSLRVLPTLLDVELPFAIEECRYAFLDVHRTAGGTTRALAVAATRAAITDRVDALRRIQLDPVALDQEGIAVWTEMLHEQGRVPVHRDAVRVVLVMEDRWSSLVIGRGKVLENGYAVRVEDTARMARLVRAQGGAGVADAAWLLVGAGAGDNAQVQHVEELVRREGLGTCRTAKQPEPFVARALARRALTAGPLRCNLRAGDVAHPRLRRRRRRRRLGAAALFLFAGVWLCAANLAVQGYAARVRRHAARAVAAHVDRLAGYPVAARGRDALGLVERHVAEQTEDLRPFRRAFEPSLADTLAAVVAEAGRRNVRCELIEIGRDHATVRGTAPEWDGVDAVARVLRQADYPVEVKRTAAPTREGVPFTVFTREGS